MVKIRSALLLIVIVSLIGMAFADTDIGDDIIIPGYFKGSINMSYVSGLFETLESINNTIDVAQNTSNTANNTANIANATAITANTTANLANTTANIAMQNISDNFANWNNSAGCSDCPNATVGTKEASWDAKTTLNEVNSSALLQSVSQILGLQGLEDSQNTSINSKTTLSEVNSSTQILRSQVTGQGGVDDSQNTSINGKEPIISTGLASQFWNGLKQWITLGIGNITGLQTALDLKDTNLTNTNNSMKVYVDSADTIINTASQSRDNVINSTKLNKTDLNTTAQITRSQVTGQEGVDTSQNASIDGKTTLAGVNTSAFSFGTPLTRAGATVDITIPTCSGTDKLTSSDGNSFTCAADQTGAGGLTNATVNPYNVNATNLTSGTVNVGRLGSGATASNYLRGDNTWQTPSGGSGLPYVRIAAQVITTSTTVYSLLFNISLNATKNALINVYLQQGTSVTGLAPQNMVNVTNNNIVGYCKFTTEVGAGTTAATIDMTSVTTSSADTGELLGVFFGGLTAEQLIKCSVWNKGATTEYVRVYTQLDAAGTLYTNASSYYTIVTN